MKTKISLFSLLAVGASGASLTATNLPSQLSFPSFNYSSNSKNKWESTNDLFSQEVTNKKSEMKLTEEEIKNSKSSAHNFKLVSSGELSSTSLTSQQEILNLSENILFSKEDKNVLSSVSALYTEMNKSSGDSDIEEHMKKKIEESNKKLKEYLTDFKEASKRIGEWTSNLDLLKNIKTEDIGKSLSENSLKVVNRLTSKEKKSLAEFYKEFFSLIKEKKELIQKFSKINNSSIMDQMDKINQNSDKVIEALKQINWEDENLEERANKLFDRSSFDQNNYFSYLMTKEEWELAKKTAMDVKRSIEYEKVNLWAERLCVWWMIPTLRSDVCYGDSKVLKNKQVLISEALDFKIASRLLLDMQRVEKEIGFALSKSN